MAQYITRSLVSFQQGTGGMCSNSRFLLTTRRLLLGCLYVVDQQDSTN